MLISMFLALSGLVAAAPLGAPAATSDRDAAGPSGGEPVAVVELFTSEGCSSCPPADAVLTELIKEHEAKEHAAKGNLIALSFHVDYWDRLGWKDPWSSAAATARQHEYATRFRSSTVYTPQMVVNGTDEFVGSDANRAKARVERALRAAPAWTITASVDAKESKAGDTTSPWPITVQAAAKPSDEKSSARAEGEVVVALVERGLSARVPRGENSGRTLRHDNVVRVFKSVAAQERVSVTLEVPSDVRREQASVVVFLQQRDGAIVGATMIGLARAKVAAQPISEPAPAVAPASGPGNAPGR